MFPLPAPLGAYHFKNRPAVPIATGSRANSSASTAINLGASVLGDFMVFSCSSPPVGGAGNWIESNHSGLRIWSKGLEAADLVPGALTGTIDLWVFCVYRGPKSLAVKSSGSGGSSVTITGFTKHVRSAGAVLVGSTNSVAVATSDWTTLRVGVSSGFNTSMRLWDKLPPGDTYVDGSAGTVSGGGASARAVMLELLNIG